MRQAKEERPSTRFDDPHPLRIVAPGTAADASEHYRTLIDSAGEFAAPFGARSGACSTAVLIARLDTSLCRAHG
ncbi:hypothetical protein [Caballeronia concitans]|uniref:hypothetical protein n=1 Tax=Caballeronia concitans TaxID=1777133 RepID=UPI000588F75C|nr:hypothetical protein [Caballeronia concitans]